MRTLRAFTALILAAFTLTGCMKLDMALSIDPHSDALNGSFIVAVDKMVLTIDGKTPEEGFATTEKNLKDVPAGTRSEVYDDGKYYGRKIIFEGYPLAEFNRQNPSTNITHEDGRYIFRMDGGAPVANSTPEQLVAVLANIEITIAVTFPGKVIEHDTQSIVHDRTVVWKMKLTDFKQIRAVSQEGSSFPWLLLAIVTGLFGALVIAAIVVFALRMNRRPRNDSHVNPAG
jgi:LppM domain